MKFICISLKSVPCLLYLNVWKMFIFLWTAGFFYWKYYFSISNQFECSKYVLELGKLLKFLISGSLWSFRGVLSTVSILLKFNHNLINLWNLRYCTNCCISQAMAVTIKPSITLILMVSKLLVLRKCIQFLFRFSSIFWTWNLNCYKYLRQHFV